MLITFHSYYNGSISPLFFKLGSGCTVKPKSWVSSFCPLDLFFCFCFENCTSLEKFGEVSSNDLSDVEFVC